MCRRQPVKGDGYEVKTSSRAIDPQGDRLPPDAPIETSMRCVLFPPIEKDAGLGHLVPSCHDWRMVAASKGTESAQTVIVRLHARIRGTMMFARRLHAPWLPDFLAERDTSGLTRM